MAQRYARVYRELGVLIGDFYSARPVFYTRRRAHALPARVRAAVLIWRAYLIRTELLIRAGTPTGRSIDSFRKRKPNVVVEFDGCPKGIGFRLFAGSTPGGLRCVRRTEKHVDPRGYEHPRRRPVQRTTTRTRRRCHVVTNLNGPGGGGSNGAVQPIVHVGLCGGNVHQMATAAGMVRVTSWPTKRTRFRHGRASSQPTPYAMNTVTTHYH